MQHRLTACALAAIAALGCASAGRSAAERTALAAAHERTRCETDAAVLGSPERLQRLASEQLEARDLPRSYCYLALLRTLHPESPAAADAFFDAAVIAKTMYMRVRHTEPQSIWLTSEPEFLFAWFERFFAGGAFPQEAAEALLRGLPQPFAERLNRAMRASPSMARWRVEVSDDNGLIEAVRGLPAQAGGH